MWQYRAAVADMLHVMTRVLDAPASWQAMPAFDGLDADTAREASEQAGRFADDVLTPTAHWTRVRRSEPRCPSPAETV